eukprot:TRINITY_DN17409_c0_g1_i1.p1 TRINITY_DN17409_c0_g1~~TRINITY_DN17409_c0_g1_i1.p1  ORF type:complete len:268 (+),score=52.96 TRINITY_DN17409_c0_g1_i1:59-805(+)
MPPKEQAGEGGAPQPKGQAIGADLLSGASANKRKELPDEIALLALKASVQQNCRPWRSGNLGAAPVFKTFASVQEEKAAREAKWSAGPGKPFHCYSHTFPTRAGAQEEQHMNPQFTDKGDWRCVPNRCQPGPWSYRRGPAVPEQPEPVRDPATFLHNRRHQAMVRETGLSEVATCLQWRGSGTEQARPLTWSRCESRSGPRRKGVFPDKRNQETVGSPALTAWKERPERVRGVRRWDSARWSSQSQLK